LKNYGADTDDIEAPIGFAADHGWLCGGRECVNEPVTAKVAQEEGAAEAVEEAVEKVKEEFQVVLEDVKERVEEVVEKVVEEVEEITARRMTIGQEEAAPAEVEEAKEEVEEAEEALEEAEAVEEVAEEELAEAEEEVAEAETPAEEEAAEEAVEEAEVEVEGAEEAVEEAEEELAEAEEELEGVQPEASLEAEMSEIDEMIAVRDARKAQEVVPAEEVEEALSDEALLAEIKEVIEELGLGDLSDERRKVLLNRLYNELVPEAKGRGLEVWDQMKEAQHGDLGGLSDERLAELVKQYTEAKEELETLAPEALDPQLRELIPVYEQQLVMLSEEIEKRKEVETPFQATRRIAALDTGTKSEEAARILADEYRRKKDEGKKDKPLKPGRPTRIKRAGTRDERLTE